MDAGTLHAQAVQCWVSRVRGMPEERWSDRTPCTEWTVRDLVGHVVGEEMWAVPLMQGSSLEAVGSAFDGDLLGDDPVAACLAAAAAARAAVDEELPVRGVVHLSYGEESAEEYVRQLAADHLVHAWDLAAATGGDTVLPEALVAEVGEWFLGRASAYRAAGLVRGPDIIGAAEAFDGTQSSLLAAFGRRPGWGRDDAALTAFAAAFGAGDVDAIMALMTPDCVFESTSPAPDGQRHEGAAAVREVWQALFDGTPDARFTTEDVFACQGRGILRWRFDWTEPDGSPGHVRGVDAVTLRDGKVCEKLSYVKG